MANFTQKPVLPRVTGSLKIEDRASAPTPPQRSSTAARQAFSGTLRVALLTRRDDGKYDVHAVDVPLDTVVNKVALETGVSLPVAREAFRKQTTKGLEAYMSGRKL